jgi:hypothetical protein
VASERYKECIYNRQGSQAVNGAPRSRSISNISLFIGCFSLATVSRHAACDVISIASSGGIGSLSSCSGMAVASKLPASPLSSDGEPMRVTRKDVYEAVSKKQEKESINHVP